MSTALPPRPPLPLDWPLDDPVEVAHHAYHEHRDLTQDLSVGALVRHVVERLGDAGHLVTSARRVDDDSQAAVAEAIYERARAINTSREFPVFSEASSSVRTDYFEMADAVLTELQRG